MACLPRPVAAPAAVVIPAPVITEDPLPLSTINIPVQVNLKPFYAMAEKKVDTIFTSPNYPKDWVQSGCDTRYKYSFRRGPLQLKATGNRLDISFTGYYRIIGSTRVCANGIAVSPWTPECKCGFDDAERRVNVSFTSMLSITPDFKSKMQVIRNEPQPLDACKVCFWGQDITRQVLNGLKAELDISRADMEKNFGTIDLRPQFVEVWKQLSRPYNLYDLGWLQINPQNLHIVNMMAARDSLFINLGLTAQPIVSFEKPKENIDPLPAMKSNGAGPGFSVFLDAQLNYDSLSQLMNKHLAGKEFDFSKGPVNRKFIIKECRLMGSTADQLMVKINYAGTKTGILYLSGQPVYTAQTRMLEVKNLDFDLRSRDALLKSAEWIFSGRITREISNQARFDLGAYIDSAKANMNKQLNHEWVKGVFSRGSINDIQLIKIFPRGNNLVIRSNCTGSLAVIVDKVDFSL